MKNWTARQILPGLCLVGAAAIACTGHDGWGWFLFVSVIFAWEEDDSE